MPNHLISPPIVTELIQQDATSEKMVSEVSKLLEDDDAYHSMQQRLAEIAPMLSENSGELACDAIDALLQRKTIKASPQ